MDFAHLISKDDVDVSPSLDIRYKLAKRRRRRRHLILTGICISALIIVVIFIAVIYSQRTSPEEHLPSSKMKGLISHYGNCSKSFDGSSNHITVLSNEISVVCDTETDGGDWILIQRKITNDIDFYRNWIQYQDGFGDLRTNFWLGLENIYKLCNQNQLCQLRFDMEYTGEPYNKFISKSPDSKYFAQYQTFYILDANDFYRLYIEGFSGTVGDRYFLSHNNGSYFTTYDRDHDVSERQEQEKFADTDIHENCAVEHHSGWWFHACADINPNGILSSMQRNMTLDEMQSVDNAIIRKAYWHDAFWFDLTGHNAVKRIEIKVRQL